MKFLAILFFSILSIAWYYFSWEFLRMSYSDITQYNKNIITAILLAWVFIFWFLLAKLLYNNNSTNSIEEVKINSDDDFFLPQINEVKNNNTYKNYDDDSEITKGSIDVILDEREENYKHNLNLKEEVLKKDFEEIIEIKKEKEEIMDKTFLNVSNSIKKKNKQDLKIIEGIWPKIEQLLNKWWIYSYKDLELSEISTIQNILENAWSRYTLHNPTTWPKQANIANNWNFEKLKTYQDKLIKWIEK